MQHQQTIASYIYLSYNKLKHHIADGTIDATVKTVAMEKIAVPQLDDAVAPRFEAARHFLVAEVESGQMVCSQVVTCDGPDGYRRVRMLQIHRVSVLICSGIKSSYRDVLVASGVKVISRYSGTVEKALEEYSAGSIGQDQCFADETAKLYPVPHADLVERAKGLFGKCGYKVAPGPGDDSSLIDLVAEMLCPVCSKPVRVAICCGAHTYRADQEIAQFHQATLSGYHARVYVSPIQPAIWQCCREYGIEPLDPDQPVELRAAESGGAIPLLSGPIINHERATDRGAL